MNEYWYPKEKWRLVLWFYNRYPQIRKWKWEKMSKEQLYGKYREMREEVKNGNKNEKRVRRTF